MSDDELTWMSTSEVIVIDAGAHQWQCGFAGDEGPGTILPGAKSDETFDAQVFAVFEALEVESTDELGAVLLSAPAATTPATRERIAKALFAGGVRRLHISASPLLALCSTGFETGVLVDVGHTHTHILAIYAGHAALPLAAATVHPIGGNAAPERGSCDALFESGNGACGLHEAVWRTVALADVSVRGALLERVVCIGGGTMLPSFVDRFEDELRRCSVSTTPPKVFATNARALATWMGGSTLCDMPSAAARFVTREALARDASRLHIGALDAAVIGELEESCLRVNSEDGRKYEEARRDGRKHACALAEDGRAWWLAQAPAAGGAERARMRTTQRVVRSLYIAALTHMGLSVAEDGGSASAPTSARRAALAALGVSDRPPASAVASTPARLSMLPASTALALGGSALQLLGGASGVACGAPGDSAWLGRRMSHILVASWAVSTLTTCGDAPAEARHHAHAAKAAVARRWRQWAEARLVAREKSLSLGEHAVRFWAHTETIVAWHEWHRQAHALSAARTWLRLASGRLATRCALYAWGVHVSMVRRTTVLHLRAARHAIRGDFGTWLYLQESAADARAMLHRAARHALCIVIAKWVQRAGQLQLAYDLRARAVTHGRRHRLHLGYEQIQQPAQRRARALDFERRSQQLAAWRDGLRRRRAARRWRNWRAATVADAFRVRCALINSVVVWRIVVRQTISSAVIAAAEEDTKSRMLPMRRGRMLARGWSLLEAWSLAQRPFVEATQRAAELRERRERDKTSTAVSTWRLEGTSLRTLRRNRAAASRLRGNFVRMHARVAVSSTILKWQGEARRRRRRQRTIREQLWQLTQLTRDIERHWGGLGRSKGTPSVEELLVMCVDARAIAPLDAAGSALAKSVPSHALHVMKAGVRGAMEALQREYAEIYASPATEHYSMAMASSPRQNQDRPLHRHPAPGLRSIHSLSSLNTVRPRTDWQPPSSLGFGRY